MMINLDKIKLKSNKKYSFIGLEKLQNSLVFHVPRGIDTCLEERASKSKIVDLYFSLYRLYAFLRNTKNKTLFPALTDRDGLTYSKEGGAPATLELNNSPILIYSKIDSIQRFLEAYQERSFIHPTQRTADAVGIPKKNLHRFLGNAIYEQDGSPFINTHYILRIQSRASSVRIEKLYCYILFSILSELKYFIEPIIYLSAKQFYSEEVGGSFAGIFRCKSHQKIWNIMDEYFHRCSRDIESRSPSSRRLVLNIQEFLYGNLSSKETGMIWGFDNFWMIWEAISVSHEIRSSNSNLVCFIDPSIRSALGKKPLATSKLSPIVTDSLGPLQSQNSITFEFKPDLVVERKRTIDERFLSLKQIPWNDYGCKCFYVFSVGNNELKLSWPYGHRIIDIEHLKNGGNINSQIVPPTVSLEDPLPERFISLPGYTYVNPRQMPGNKSFSEYIQSAAGCFWQNSQGDFQYYCDNVDDLKISYTVYSWLDAIGDIRIRYKKLGYDSPSDLIKNIDSLGVVSSSFGKSFSDILLRDASSVQKNLLTPLYVSNLVPPQVEIVDSKYKDLDYYDNLEDGILVAKDRDIRKQMCYEELIARGFLKNDESVNLKSTFLLPVCSLLKEELILPKACAELKIASIVNVKMLDIIKVADSFTQW